jgi:hypothetical protein
MRACASIIPLKVNERRILRRADTPKDSPTVADEREGELRALLDAAGVWLPKGQHLSQFIIILFIISYLSTSLGLCVEKVLVNTSVSFYHPAFLVVIASALPRQLSQTVCEGGIINKLTQFDGKVWCVVG